MKNVLKYLSQYKGGVILISLLTVIEAVGMLLLPYTMSDIINIGIATGDIVYIWQKGFVMLGIAGVVVVCQIIANKAICNMRRHISSTKRRQIVDKVLRLDAEQFSQFGTAGLLTRSTEDVEQLEMGLFTIPKILIMLPIYFIGSIVLTALKSWTLALILLGATPIIVLCMWLILRKQHSRYEQLIECREDHNRILRERLVGIRVVRSFNKDEYENTKTKEALGELRDSIIIANNRFNVIEPLISLILNIAVVVIIYVAAIGNNNGIVTQAGDISAIVQYVLLLSSSLMLIAYLMDDLPWMQVSIDRIEEVLAMPEGDQIEHIGHKLGGNVNIDKLCYSYSNSQVDTLHSVSMNIAEGETIAILGGTGSGKTTLVKVLLDLVGQYRGSIALGDMSYSALSGSDIRENISVSLQKPFIFGGSIRDNITLANSNMTDEQLGEIVDIAQLSGFVDSCELGLDYILTENGGNISGGQKQRISIARTLAKDASVYVFDDSFSALDYITETNLRKQLNVYLQGKTQIIITQRVSTAMRCDKTYVMDNGALVGSGTHEQLKSTCQVYMQTCQSQLGGDN